MRKYTAKTLEECLKEAAADLQVEEKDIKRTKSKFPNLRKDIKGALFKNIKKE